MFPSFVAIFPILFCLIGINCKSITITWSTPESSKSDPLKAINSHLHALHLANTLPNLLGVSNGIQIKLCPPQPFDPLVKEFTVPRLSAYSLLYDHECIQKAQEGLEIKWGSKPKKPAVPSPPTDKDVYAGEGLTVPSFIYELFKYTRKPAESTDSAKIWLLDSDSLRAWYTAPILNYLIRPSGKEMIPPADLMRQVNAMYGSLGEKDLKNMPQAVQDSLLIILPDYSAWPTRFNPKFLFNPTWWSTHYVPRSHSEILEYCKRIIDNRRKADQLVIVHHQPTSFNFEIVAQLAGIYGQKVVISSTRVLPKTFTTVQLLQFIHKAAGVVIDTRDTLGQVSLLVTGFSTRVAFFQSYLPYTKAEYVLYISLTLWFIAVVYIRAYFTHKHYTVPLHIHAKRFLLFAILAITPLYIFNPIMWPKYLSMTVFGLFESGLGIIVYIITGFYAVAGFITLGLVAADRYKKSKSRLENDEEFAADSVDDPSDTESIQLIPK